jgi:hypothetical protein
MAGHDVFPPEMPDHPSSPILPLDDPTAERLLSGRLDPDDAPPAYAPVARLLRAAAAPPGPDELARQPAALAAFRAEWRGRAGVRGPVGGRGRMRRRLVAVALAGALVVGGAAAGAAASGGLWTVDAIPSLGRLHSPAAGPGTGGPGSGGPGVGHAATAGDSHGRSRKAREHHPRKPHGDNKQPKKPRSKGPKEASHEVGDRHHGERR